MPQAIELEFDDRGDVLRLSADTIEGIRSMLSEATNVTEFHRFFVRSGLVPTQTPKQVANEVVSVDEVQKAARSKDRSKDLADPDVPASPALLMVARNAGVEIEDGVEYTSGMVRELIKEKKDGTE